MLKKTAWPLLWIVVVMVWVAPGRAEPRGPAAVNGRQRALAPNSLIVGCAPYLAVVHDYGEMSLVVLESSAPRELLEGVHLLAPAGRVNYRSWSARLPSGANEETRRGGVLVLGLVGPLDRVWRRELEAAGVEILAPADPHAIVVRTDEDGLREAMGMATSEGFAVVSGVVALPLEARVERSLAPVLRGGRPREVRGLSFFGYRGHGLRGEMKDALDGVREEGIAPETLRQLLLDHPEIGYVEPEWSAVTHNNLAARPGLLAVEPVWLEEGYNGTGVTVSHNDSGVDLSHPDVVGAVKASIGRMAYADTAHGTHTAGSIIGRGSGPSPENTSGCGDLTEPLDRVRGMAWGAELVTNNLFEEGLQQVPAMMRWGAVHGALVSSNSWGLVNQGEPVAGYTLAAVEADAATRDADVDEPGEQPLTIFFSTGNLGPRAGTVTSPATAKNVISVGAVENNRCGSWVPGRQAGPDISTVVTTSGRGPSQARLKPDLVAPGSDVLSLESGDTYAQQPWDETWTGPAYALNTGTSQACALAAGAGAVFHEFYWRTRGRRPSPALVKAALIAGAEDDDNGPDFDRGWGRLALDGAVHGPGDGTVTFFDQTETDQLVTGDSWDSTIVVRSSTEPLIVVAVWTDVPGEADANHPLVNDLDVVLAAPDGTVYRGNIFDGLWSRPDPGTARDSDNNLEVIKVDNPGVGEWLLDVVAVDVPENPPGLTGQDFAVVVGGDAGNCSAPPPPPAGLDAVAAGEHRIELSWISVPGATRYEVFRSRTQGGQPYLPLTVVEAPATTFVDTDVSGSISYHYVVRAERGCWSPYSYEVSVTAVGACTLPPLFDGLESVGDRHGAGCSFGLDWAPAVSECGAAVVYDVYRGNWPGFQPGVANRIVGGLSSTSWTDGALVDGASYHYVVRARDAGQVGDDGNLARLSGQPSGPDDLYIDEGAENGFGDWLREPGSQADSGTDRWTLTDDDSWSGSSAWFVADEARVKDQVFQTAFSVAIPAEGEPYLEFMHRFQLDRGADGGRLEVSTNGGLDWIDALEGDGQTVPDNPDRWIEGGYLATIGSPSNPLFRADGWTGDSRGWVRSALSLADFAGRDILLRWRLGCDDSVTLDRGWWLDDIRIVVERPCQSCVPPPPPPGLRAEATSSGVVLQWESVADARAYLVSRSTETGGPYQLLDTVDEATTTYLDATASGGTGYAYVVAVETDCRSENSPEVTVTAGGPCLLAPRFWGLDLVSDPRDARCAMDLEWRPAEPGCVGSEVRYRVYRSNTAGFTPGPSTLVADGVVDARHRDITVADGVRYFFRVRAVDSTSLAEDANLVEHAGETTGPDEVLFSDSMEGSLDAWRTGVGSSLDPGTQPWEIDDLVANSGERSWFCLNEANVKDQVVALVDDREIIDDTTVLAFRHIFDLEAFWDGGRLEYSTDGGSTWHDILDGDGATVGENPDRFLEGGYSGFISVGTGNPLGGEAAWTGFVSYWLETVVSLEDFVGLSVRFRWRLGCDASAARDGWWVDDVELRITNRCQTTTLPPPRSGAGRRPH